MADIEGITQETFRRDYKILVFFIRNMAMVLFIACAILLHLVYKGPPERNYYAMSFDETRLPLVPYNEPHIDPRAITAWAAKVSGELLTIGFNDYAQRLGALRPYFTDIGWQSFTKSIIASEFIGMLLDQSLLMTAVPGGEPEIIFEGVESGRYIWRIECNVVVTGRAGPKSNTLTKTVTMTVVKVPSKLNPAGLAIEGIRLT